MPQDGPDIFVGSMVQIPRLHALTSQIYLEGLLVALCDGGLTDSVCDFFTKTPAQKEAL